MKFDLNQAVVNETFSAADFVCTDRSPLFDIVTMKEIHAHEVLEWIAADVNGKSPEEIVAFAETELGADSTYHTCSRSGMDIRQLIEFFIDAQKTLVVDGRLSINRQRMCSH